MSQKRSDSIASIAHNESRSGLASGHFASLATCTGELSGLPEACKPL